MNLANFRILPILLLAGVLLLGGCGTPSTETETEPDEPITTGGTEGPPGVQNLIVEISSPIDNRLYNRPDPEFIYSVTEGEQPQPVPVGRLQAFVHDVVDEQRKNARTIPDLVAASRLPVVQDGLHELEFVVTDEDGERLVTVFVKYSTAAVPVADAGIDQTVHAGDPVVLLGSESYSLVGDPITYEWTILSMPEGSLAELSESTVVSPSFVADFPGEYIIQLVVRDSDGDESEPDLVTVSTENTAPVADAGGDQVVSTLGDVVEIDGSQSFDEDGDDLTYHWELTSKPEDSNAEISDPNDPVAVFGVDVQGTYELTLVVSDAFGAVSEPKTVVVTFYNVAPVAEASTGQSSVYVGDPVYLDGSGSHDANLDELFYNWSMASRPPESAAALTSLDTVDTSFVPDFAGTYVSSLVVSDGALFSQPSNVSVAALTYDQPGNVDPLVLLLETIAELDDEHFKNRKNKKALGNKILVVLGDLDEGHYVNAWLKLALDISRKTNGCAWRGEPDSHDWVVTCEAQDVVYPLIREAMSNIAQTIGGEPKVDDHEKDDDEKDDGEKDQD
jgi:hypothetical protein